MEIASNLSEHFNNEWYKQNYSLLFNNNNQIGGNHYSKLKIDPYEYCHANNIGMLEGNVIKYVTRWRDKGGIEDLRKAISTLERLISMENNNK